MPGPTRPEVLAAGTGLAGVAQERADEVMAALGGTVEGIKEGLRQRGIGSGALRMPTPPVVDVGAIERLVE